jgi:excisionase family DNA binding protein
VNKRNNLVLNDVLLRLRALLPKQRVTCGQARATAQQLALHLRTILGASETRLSLDFIEAIPGVTVELLPQHEMEALTKSPWASGATDIRKDGTYRIYINKSSSVTHCRFTLAHELFHVVTGPFEADIFGDFGFGNDELHRRRAEQVADHFAANLLMPSATIKQAWSIPIRELPELAALFGVSEDAMQVRLRTIGLVDTGLTKQMFYRQPARLQAPRAPDAAGRGEREALSDQLSRGAQQTGSPANQQTSSSLWLRDLSRTVPDSSESAGPGVRLLTVNEASAELRVSRWTVNRLIRERRLQTIKIGTRRLVPRTAVLDLVDRLASEESA